MTKKKTLKKPLPSPKKTKNVKVFEEVHTDLKVHVAKNSGTSMVEVASEAIQLHIKK